MGLLRDHLPEPASYFESQGLVLQPGAKWRTTRCDFHDGSDSMRVNVQTGAWVCMAGCGAKGGDVLAYQMQRHDQPFIQAAKALGAWQDDPRDETQPRRKPLPFPARDALEVLADEAMLVAVAAGNVAHGVVLSAVDRARLMQAAGRINVIAEASA
jgi:hypothetical protein